MKIISVLASYTYTFAFNNFNMNMWDCPTLYMCDYWLVNFADIQELHETLHHLQT